MATLDELKQISPIKKTTKKRPDPEVIEILSDPEPELPLLKLLAPSDEVVKNGPGGSVRQRLIDERAGKGVHQHPRNVRILPPSRDFH